MENHENQRFPKGKLSSRWMQMVDVSSVNVPGGNSQQTWEIVLKKSRWGFLTNREIERKSEKMMENQPAKMESLSGPKNYQEKLKVIQQN